MTTAVAAAAALGVATDPAAAALEWPQVLARVLPRVNACLNATSAVCLWLGYRAVRRGRLIAHPRLMLTALGVSLLFLVGYLTRMALTGTHRFAGTGPIKAFYLVLLTSHMVLAIALVPLVLQVLRLAWAARFVEHRRWARITWPLWMYVSVTGVIVYGMLYHVAPRLAPP